MPGVNHWISVAQRKYGIPARVLKGLIKVESGGDINAISSAGAFGLTQFMPGTAKGYGVKRGDPRSQILGAAHYLSDLGFSKDPKLALSSYNAGPGNPSAAGDYADKVLGAAGGPLSISKSGGIGQMSTPTAPNAEPGKADLYGTLASLARSTDPDSMAALNYEFMRGLEMLSGPQQAPAEAQSRAMGLNLGEVGPVNMDLLKGHPLDRPGVQTGKPILNFAGRVASVYGHPITLGTGTQHNQFSTSGLQSAHWTGDALDLPSSGKALTQMGQSALIAAGMSPAQARKIKGGLYNVGGYQIIFNTNEGGNHYDHLHVGLRRRK